MTCWSSLVPSYITKNIFCKQYSPARWCFEIGALSYFGIIFHNKSSIHDLCWETFRSYDTFTMQTRGLKSNKRSIFFSDVFNPELIM